MALGELRSTLGELWALPGQLTRSALLVPGMVNRASRVLEDVARIVEAVDELLDVVRGTLTRIEHTADAAAALPKRMARVLEQTEGLPAAVAAVVEQTEALPGRLVQMLEQTEALPGRVVHVLEQTETLPRRVAHLLEQSEVLPGQAVVVIERASGVFDGATDLIAEIDGLPAQLRPLVTALAELDPGVATQLGHLIPTLGPLLTRLEEEVIPSVMSINSLVPVVELLHRNVDELSSVVSQMGKLISSVPGASMLRRRADNSTKGRGSGEGADPTDA